MNKAIHKPNVLSRSRSNSCSIHGSLICCQLSGHILVCADLDVKGLPALRSLEILDAMTVMPIVAPALTCLKWSYYGEEINGFQAICSDAMIGMQNLVILDLDMMIWLAAVRPLQEFLISDSLIFCYFAKFVIKFWT